MAHFLVKVFLTKKKISCIQKWNLFNNSLSTTCFLKFRVLGQFLFQTGVNKESMYLLCVSVGGLWRPRACGCVRGALTMEI